MSDETQGTVKTPRFSFNTPSPRQLPQRRHSSLKVKAAFKSPMRVEKKNGKEDVQRLEDEVKRLTERNGDLDAEIEKFHNEGYKVEELEEHIKKLHDYNEIKDVGQMLLGRIDILDAGPSRQYFYVSLVLVIISLLLQIVTGYLLLMVDQMKNNVRQFSLSCWNRVCCASKSEETIFSAYWCQCYFHEELGLAYARYKQISLDLLRLRYIETSNDAPSKSGNHQNYTSSATHGGVQNGKDNCNVNISFVPCEDDSPSSQDTTHTVRVIQSNINAPNLEEIERLDKIKDDLEDVIISMEKRLVERRLGLYYLTLSILMYIVITINVFITAFSVVETINGNTGSTGANVSSSTHC